MDDRALEKEFLVPKHLWSLTDLLISIMYAIFIENRVPRKPTSHNLLDSKFMLPLLESTKTWHANFYFHEPFLALSSNRQLGTKGSGLSQRSGHITTGITWCDPMISDVPMVIWAATGFELLVGDRGWFSSLGRELCIGDTRNRNNKWKDWSAVNVLPGLYV